MCKEAWESKKVRISWMKTYHMKSNYNLMTQTWGVRYSSFLTSIHEDMAIWVYSNGIYVYLTHMDVCIG